MYPMLMQMLLLAFLKNFQAKSNLTENEKRSLEMFIEQAKSLLKDKWKFIMQHLNDQVLQDSFHSMVPFPTMLGFDTLVAALQKIAEIHYRKMGVPLNFILQCDAIVDAVNQYFVENEVFMNIFVTHVWVFFRTDLKVAIKMDRELERLSNLPPQVVSAYAAIVARTAVTFTQGPQPVEPAFVSDAPQSAPPPLDEPANIVSVLPYLPPRNDATNLILAGVKAALQSCVANAVAMAAESFSAGNRSNVMAITGADLDAQVLATEVTCVANDQALEAAAKMFAALEVVKLVTTAADAGETINPVSPPDSPGVKSLMASNDFLVQIQDLQSGMGHQSLPVGFLKSVNDASSTIASILYQIEDLKSNTTSPLPDGRRRAPFTTSALSPQQCVEDTATEAHPPFSAADLSRSAAEPKSFKSNLGSNLSSGPSRTTLTHELADLLASLPILSLSSSTPADSKPIVHSSEWAGIGVSTKAQSSGKSSGNVTYPPPLPNLLASLDPLPSTQSSSSRGNDIGVGGAHSLDIPSKSALFHVDVSVNPHADQPSSTSQGKVGGPPVQVLASSGNPPGNSGVVDQSKTPSRFNRWSSCRPDRTDLSASPPPPNLFGTKGKPVRPLPPTPVIPSSVGTDIGGSPRAHSPDDPSEIVPPSAPSSSSALRSAATPSAAPLNEKPPTKWGVEIGGIEHSGNMMDLSMVILLGAHHLLHLGVPLAQAPLFSHIPPVLLAQAAYVA